MPTDLGYSPAAAREDAKAEDRENEGAGKREKESNELEIEAQEEAGEQEEDEVRAAPPPTSSANAAHVTTVFGMKRSNPNVKSGHDSYNYEEKYPEDGPYEEAAPTARVWRTHQDESRIHDSNMVEQFRDSVNLLLVSAGLFSAVVTAFVVQSSQNLRPDYAAMSASLLYELVLIQRAATANGSSANVITSPLEPSIAFVPATADVWVNGLWFTSLFLSLTTALVAVLVKQWLHHYVILPSGTPRDRSLVRQFRYAGFRKWHVQTIIGLLPIIIHLALTIFLVGLVVFLYPLHAILSWIICAGTILVYGVYMVAAILPILFPQCPYRTPLCDLIYAAFHHAVPQVSWSLWRKDAFLDALRRRCFNDMLRHLPRVQTRSMKTLAKIESESVQQMSTKLAAEALDWLFSVSSNPTVQSIVIQAIGGLPMTSEHEFFELQSYADRKAMEDMQRALLRSCLQPDEENPEQHDRPIPGMELKVGRLLRFDAHFNDVFMWDRRIVMPDTEPSELATTINSTYWGYLADGPAGFSTLAALFKDCIRAESSLKLPLLRWSHLLRCVGRGDVFSPLSPETDDDTNSFPIDLCSAILDSFGRSMEHPIQDFSSPIVLEFKDAVPYIHEKIHDNALQMFSDFIPRSLSGQRYASLSKPLKLLIVVMEFLRRRLTLSESDNIICSLLITAVKQLDGETFSFQEATAVIIFLEDILPVCFIRDACNAELTRNELCYNTILAYQHSITISPSACSVRGLRLMVDVMTADWEHKSDYQWYQSDIPCRVLAHLLANLIPNVYTVFLDKQCLQVFGNHSFHGTSVRVIREYIAGISAMDEALLRQHVEYLQETRNLFTACSILAARGNEDADRAAIRSDITALVRLCPQATTWDECRGKLHWLMKNDDNDFFNNQRNEFNRRLQADEIQIVKGNIRYVIDVLDSLFNGRHICRYPSTLRLHDPQAT